MAIAKEVSSNSTCPRASVGALLVNDDRVIGIGYNGAPRGLPHCTDVGCDIVSVNGKDHCTRSAHAEENVVANAAYGAGNTKGSTLYCTLSPCYTCSRMLLNAGVSQVYYLTEYPDDKAKILWECSTMKVSKVCSGV